MESMFEILMQLPLFQGVSRNKISELIEKTKFHFLKYARENPSYGGEKNVPTLNSSYREAYVPKW